MKTGFITAEDFAGSKQADFMNMRIDGRLFILTNVGGISYWVSAVTGEAFTRPQILSMFRRGRVPTLELLPRLLFGMVLLTTEPTKPG